MIKAILSFLLLFLLTVTSLPSVALAKEGDASLRTDPTRRYVFLTFSNLQTISKVNYTLTYEVTKALPAGRQGFVGGFKTYGRLRRSVRRQILGTCSSGRCVFHKNPHGFQLDVTFYLKSGGTSSITKTLP